MSASWLFSNFIWCIIL